ncbi:16S rRNA (cytidine(1402)-2'-O)-methyltransferase [Alkalicoccobacillus plakortidis]|uniref:Ribosomal RNA small subunit methyltransferase I n=1 Tax=Alkalicoccobacillus plakortidis TaxID=444060 RepID=A0ABT0XKQ9_9BACI|nr:16S rRNA (cytidine(1402)-2'-O)-methyltransferase [Alkalicoccobacillus plakortidis]MCM2676494.1 16S rRNA (cytidine(1402)-2'-O)-methyltransferase [Alkalicoccobacillus plakortidis]
MQQQISYQTNPDKGVLYLVPTPIGNLEDMTFRAVRILNEVDVIAAEDTRQTRKLCSHFDIHTPLTRYDEHTKEKVGAHLIKQIKDGKSLALVSDAGMPAISDPGQEIVKLAISEEIAVIVLPGANAALTALVASGLSTNQFYYYGFLPRQKKARAEELKQISSINASLIFYESPHRIKETLSAIYEVLGNRQISIGRELTKKFEEYQRGTVEESLSWVETGIIKGEFVIVVDGTTEQQQEEKWWTELAINQHVEHYVSLGLSSKEAIKQVATEREVQKRDVYQSYHLDE